MRVALTYCRILVFGVRLSIRHFLSLSLNFSEVENFQMILYNAIDVNWVWVYSHSADVVVNIFHLSPSHLLFPYARHQLSAEWLLCLMPCTVCEHVIAGWSWKVSYKLYVFVLLNTVKNECASKLLANVYWLLAGVPIGSINGVRLLPPKISQ